jgi:hypothetical protein
MNEFEDKELQSRPKKKKSIKQRKERKNKASFLQLLMDDEEFLYFF